MKRRNRHTKRNTTHSASPHKNERQRAGEVRGADLEEVLDQHATDADLLAEGLEHRRRGAATAADRMRGGAVHGGAERHVLQALDRVGHVDGVAEVEPAHLGKQPRYAMSPPVFRTRQ